VVEEILDAQRPGCPPEYFNMKVPLCHPLFDPDCRGDGEIPFLRTRYDFNTGYNPNHPRQQVCALLVLHKSGFANIFRFNIKKHVAIANVLPSTVK